MQASCWKLIPGFDRYEASDDGRIRPVQPRYKVSAIEFWLAELVGEVLERRGQVLEPWIVERHRRRAAYVTLFVHGTKSKQLVHRLVCLAFHGLPPEGHDDCAHIDHDSLNNRASNLKWSTHADNVADCWSEEAIERRARWEDACYAGPNYMGPSHGAPF